MTRAQRKRISTYIVHAKAGAHGRAAFLERAGNKQQARKRIEREGFRVLSVEYSGKAGI